MQSFKRIYLQEQDRHLLTQCVALNSVKIKTDLVPPFLDQSFGYFSILFGCRMDFTRGTSENQSWRKMAQNFRQRLFLRSQGLPKALHRSQRGARLAGFTFQHFLKPFTKVKHTNRHTCPCVQKSRHASFCIYVSKQTSSFRLKKNL